METPKPQQGGRSRPASVAEQRLADGRVLIVGAGGLGTPAALCLAAAGVGTIGLIDVDAVAPSNLHRQVLYRDDDVGRRKVVVAAERLAALYPQVAVQIHDERLSPQNLAQIFNGFDFVIDGTDHIASKYLINDGAILRRVPFSHAGVIGFQGQTMTVLPLQSACLRCLFPIPPPVDEIPTCQETGVIGSVAGTIGVLQASEAIKYLQGTGTLLIDRMLTYDGLSERCRTIRLSRAVDCPSCGGAVSKPARVDPAGN